MHFQLVISTYCSMLIDYQTNKLITTTQTLLVCMFKFSISLTLKLLIDVS